MTAVPTTRTWTAGEIVTAGLLNTAVRDVDAFLLARPAFKGRQTVAQSLTNSTTTAITLDVEDHDSAGGHSTATNTSRYTAVYPGWYSQYGGIGYATNATGVRTVEYDVNGTVQPGCGVLLFSGQSSGSARIPGRGFESYLNVGDYTQMVGFQNSGGPLNTAVSGQEQSSYVVRWAHN